MNLKNELINNLNYVYKLLKINIDNNFKNIDKEYYFELSKEQVINYLSDIYIIINKWIDYAKTSKYDLICNEYNNLESIISELELCLVDYDNILHINGISYSIYEIGNILIDIKKEG